MGGGAVPLATRPQALPNRASKGDQTLAEAQADTQCTLKVGIDKNGDVIREPVTLRLKVQVHTCPIPLQTRLGYYGTIILRRNGRLDQEIGSIVAWRVSKPSRAQPSIDRQPFVQEMLRMPLNRHPEFCAWNELAQAMRAVYTLNGRPRTTVNSRVRPMLEDDGSELVFIQLLHILWQDKNGLGLQGNRFGPLAMDMFYRILTSPLLPSWYAVKTPATFLLVPGIPEGDAAARWENTGPPGEDLDSDEFFDRVEGSLTAMYRRWGYEIYISNAKLATAEPGCDTVITVLGLTFQDPLSSAADDQMLTGPDFSVRSPPPPSPASDSPMRHRRIEAPDSNSNADGPAAAATSSRVEKDHLPVPSLNLDQLSGAIESGDYIPFSPC